MHLFWFIHLGPAAISKGYRPGRVSEEHEEEKHPHQPTFMGIYYATPPNATPPKENKALLRHY